ncbi:hypothetical protein AB0J47_40070 [Nocardia sp. NPDC049737]
MPVGDLIAALRHAVDDSLLVLTRCGGGVSAYWTSPLAVREITRV